MAMLVSCDRDAATPLSEYLVFVHGPFTSYVSQINKHRRPTSIEKTFPLIHIHNHIKSII
jgi:hypothetical protein